MVQCLWFIWLIPFHQLYWLIPFVAGRYPIRNRSRIDPEWSETIERLEIDYNEKGRFPAHLATKFYSYRNRWDLVGHFEVPYYALLYTNITSEGHPDVSGQSTYNQFVSTRPGSACGGILVNQKQVLTTCGCLYAWWRFIKYSTLTEEEKRLFNAEYQIFRFTMFSKVFPRGVDKTKYIPTIYMSHSQVYFAPDFSHTIENDLGKHTATWLNCSSWDAIHFKPHELIYGLVLANFNPEIQDLDLSSYIPWPPVPIANLTHYSRLRPVSPDSIAVYPTAGIRARVVGMGFQGEGGFTDDLGSTINVEDSMADAEAEVVRHNNIKNFVEGGRPGFGFSMITYYHGKTMAIALGFDEVDDGLQIDLEECKKKFDHLNKLTAYVKDYVVCLKGVVDGDGYNSVRNGLPGNPVLTGFGSLAGMVLDAESLSVKEHYYVIINFISGLQYKIENENNGYLLQRQKIVRAPLYREGGWEKIFLQYTIPPKEEVADPQQRSASAQPALRPNIQTFFILLLPFLTLF